MLVFRAGIHKILVRIANREDSLIRLLLQKQSDLSLCCLSRPFWQATCGGYSTTFTANVNAQVSSEASSLNFEPGLHLYFYLVYTKSKGSGKTTWMSRLI